MVARADLEVVLRATDRATPTIKSLESSVIRFVGAISASLAGLSAIAFPVAQAAKFEKELKNVQKTTGFTDDEIKLLSEDLITLSRRLTDSATDLAQIAATAGQLGIRGRDNIVAFTESVSRAATALDLTAESAAIAGARILNIFNIDVSQLENVFATLNELSNTTTANAQQLLDTIARIGPIAGLQLQQVSALAATALDLGVSPEVAGTSLVKVFSRIQAQAGKFAKELGLEIGEFIGLGAEERFRTFLDFLSRQSEVTRAELTRTLAGSGRIFSLVNKFVEDASRGFEQFNKNIVTSNQAFLDGTSAVEEYENVADALLPRLANLRNNFVALSLEVGETLIPELKEATEDLAEFLRGDAAKNFAANLGEAFSRGVNSIIKFVKAVADLDVNLVNVIASFRVLIAFKIVQLFIGLGAQLALNATRMIALGRATAFTVLQMFAFQKATIGQAAATAAATVRLTGFRKAAQLLVSVVFGKIKLILVAVAAISAFLFRAEILSSDLVQSIGNFFGFISEAEAKQQSERIQRINELAKKARAASTEFRSLAQDQIAGTFDTALEIDFDSGLQDFETELNRVQSGIVRLATGLDSAQEVVSATVAREEAVTQELLEQELLLQRHQELLARLESTTRDVGRGQTTVTQETRDQITATKTLIEVDQARVSALQRAQEGIRKEVDLVTQTFENLDDAAAGLGANLVGELSESQLRLIRLNLELKNFQEESANAAEKVEDLKQAQVEQGQVTLENEARIQAAATAFQAAGVKIVDTQREIADATANLNDGELAIAQRQFAALGDIAGDNLTTVVEVFKGLEEAAPAASGATIDLRDKLVELGVSLAALNQQKEAVGELGASAKEAAKTAQGAFDNTNRTIRAFRGAIVEAKRELETGLEDRVIELRIRRRRTEFDARIEDAEQRKNDIIEQFQERIDNSRTGTERIYLERRKADALDAIKRETDLVEAERAALEERALRERFERLRERVEGFIQQAQAAAKRGDLDEALGFQEAAKTASKSLGGIISQLGELETTDPFGNVSFRVTENEIRALIAEFGAVEGQVSRSIPGINQDLRDSTKAASDVFAEVEANIEERLKDVNSELELLRDTVPNVRAIVESIGEAVQGTEGFAELARRSLQAQALAAQAGGGRIDEQANIQAIVDATSKAIISSVDLTTRAGADAAARAARGLDVGFATASAEIVANNKRISELRALSVRAAVRGDQEEADALRAREANLRVSNSELVKETQQRARNTIQSETLETANGRLLVATNQVAGSLEANQIQLRNAQAEQRRILNESVTRPGGGSLTQREDDRVTQLSRIITNLEGAIRTQEAEIAAGTRVRQGGGELQAQRRLEEFSQGIGLRAPSEQPEVIAETGRGFYAAMEEDSKNNPLTAAIPPTAEPSVSGFTGFARGGAVSGPGSGTSDSIPAFLSNGEYVVDALTTRLLGSKFFSGLQALARGGRKMRRPSIPGFAAGGLVGSSGGGGLASMLQSVSDVAGGLGGGSPVNITLPGGGQLELATGVSSVADVQRVMANEARKVGRRVRR